MTLPPLQMTGHNIDLKVRPSARLAIKLIVNVRYFLNSLSFIFLQDVDDDESNIYDKYISFHVHDDDDADADNDDGRIIQYPVPVSSLILPNLFSFFCCIMIYKIFYKVGGFFVIVKDFCEAFTSCCCKRAWKLHDIIIEQYKF